MKIIVFFMSFCSRRTSFCMSRRMSGSSALNGSSNSMISGSVASALASPTRCCMPPDSSSGKRSPHPPSPTTSSTSVDLARRASLSTPWISSPNATLSTMRRCGSSPKCWKTMLIFVRRTVAKLVDVHLHHVVAVDQDLARRRIVDAVEHAHEGGLAGA